MASRNNHYDVDQIMYSFMRYRSEHFYDMDSFRAEFIKHFNPQLFNKVGGDVFDRREIQSTLKDNRKMLEDKGKLPKFTYTNAELKDVKEIPAWDMGTIKGRHVRVKRVKIKIKNKERFVFRDSYGRFASHS